MTEEESWWLSIRDVIVIAHTEYIQSDYRDPVLALGQYMDPFRNSLSPVFNPIRTKNNFQELSTKVDKGPLLSGLSTIDLKNPKLAPRVDAVLAIATILIDIRAQNFEEELPTSVSKLVEAVESLDDRSQSIDLIEETADDLRTLLQMIAALIEIKNTLPTTSFVREETDEEILKQEIQSAILEYDLSTIQSIHSAIVNCMWTQSAFGNFDYRSFEQLVAMLYNQKGYQTKVLSKGADGGIDVIATQDGKKKLIQAKHEKAALSAPQLDQYVSLFEYYDADEVIVVTSSSFTGPARNRASKVSKPLTLIDGQTLCWHLTRANIAPPIIDDR